MPFRRVQRTGHGSSCGRISRPEEKQEGRKIMRMQGSFRQVARAGMAVATAAVAATLFAGTATADTGQVRLANACTDPHQASGVIGKWGPASESTCAVFGSPGHKQGYSWNVQESTNQYACVEGWGFDKKHPKGGWFSLGCGTSGKGSLPWGNVAANPKVRAKSMGGSIAVIVDWRQ
jgi:hypothetical protein